MKIKTKLYVSKCLVIREWGKLPENNLFSRLRMRMRTRMNEERARLVDNSSNNKQQQQQHICWWLLFIFFLIPYFLVTLLVMVLLFGSIANKSTPPTTQHSTAFFGVCWRNMESFFISKQRGPESINIYNKKENNKQTSSRTKPSCLQALWSIKRHRAKSIN